MRTRLRAPLCTNTFVPAGTSRNSIDGGICNQVEKARGQGLQNTAQAWKRLELPKRREMQKKCNFPSARHQPHAARASRALKRTSVLSVRRGAWLFFHPTWAVRKEDEQAPLSQETSFHR